MKRYILLFVIIILLGAAAIFLPHKLASNNKEKEEFNKLITQKKTEHMLKQIQSTSDTINIKEHEQQESELYDQYQMYFEGIEVLYDYLHFNQIDIVKQKIQFYIHQNIDKGILDCYLDKNSIQENNNILSFKITIDNNNIIEVNIIKLDNGKELEISIIDSLKN